MSTRTSILTWMMVLMAAMAASGQPTMHFAQSTDTGSATQTGQVAANVNSWIMGESTSSQGNTLYSLYSSNNGVVSSVAQLPGMPSQNADECDMGSDGYLVCTQSDNIYSFSADKQTVTQLPGAALVPSVGSTNWFVVINSQGNVYQWINSGWSQLSVGTGANQQVTYASVGSDGVMGFLLYGDSTPRYCQLSATSATNCANTAQAFDGACVGFQLVNAQNVLCWNTAGNLYWRVGGATFPPSGSWSQITTPPVPVDLASRTNVVASVFTRPNMGCNATRCSFVYHGTDGTFYIAQFPTQPSCAAGYAGVYPNCAICPAGSYSNAGDTSCTLCAAGYFSSQPGSSICGCCDYQGYTPFYSNAGATACTDCGYTCKVTSNYYPCPGCRTACGCCLCMNC